MSKRGKGIGRDRSICYMDPFPLASSKLADIPGFGLLWNDSEAEA